MKRIYIFLVLVAFLFSGFSLNAQTEWTGSKITFTKNGGADWTQEANQDRITNNVWITRANNKGLFNIAQESSFQGMGQSSPSPIDTEWAFGSISDGVQNLTFTTWGGAHAGNPSNLISQDMVLHLITDDIYIDIKLLSWGGAGQGAPFSYERSTNNLSTDEFQSLANIKLYPNPSKNYIKVSGIASAVGFKLYNILGTIVKTGSIENNKEIDIQNLSKGAYFIKLENGATLKFIKQ